MIRVDPVGGGCGDGGRPEAHRFIRDGTGDGDFVDAVLGERHPDGIAESVEEEGTDADGALDSTVFAVTGFGHAEMERVVHVLLGHAFDEEAVGLDHDFGIR